MSINKTLEQRGERYGKFKSDTHCTVRKLMMSFLLETYIHTGSRLSSMCVWCVRPQRARSGERALVQIATQER